ncbi:MAG: SAM-dependent methlyltransferase [Verrucomicrobia bacterium]|nr:SAM-dependent methlyltransferase [Verrucomicrobiota bacterium]
MFAKWPTAIEKVPMAKTTQAAAANFDPLARVYRALEIVAFGGDLERARFCLLPRLAGCRSILILGEGDGRCAERLLTVAPSARIHCVDSSPAMIAQAKARVAGKGGGERVTFECADVLGREFPVAGHDAVVTLFFLDCFEPEQAEAVVGRIAAALQPGARWLFADFVRPEKGLARLRARLWLAVLYAFFRWQTGLRVRALPPSEMLIEKAGFEGIAAATFQHGLLRTRLFVENRQSRIEKIQRC